jgi:hypothetical protein
MQVASHPVAQIVRIESAPNAAQAPASTALVAAAFRRIG